MKKNKSTTGCLFIICTAIIFLWFLNWLFFGDQSSYVSGLNKYEGLPVTASNISVYKNTNISGMFIGDFTMNEDDFITFAKGKGLRLDEADDSSRIYSARDFYEGKTSYPHLIKNGLYGKKRARNGGGITLGYDRDTNKGYINKSSR